MKDVTIVALIAAALSLIHSIRSQFRIDKLERQIDELKKGEDA
jgi:hypothetical protein